MNKIQYKKYVIFEVIKYKYKNMHICIILFNFSRQQDLKTTQFHCLKMDDNAVEKNDETR